MTVGELTEKCSKDELAHWQAIAQMDHEDRQKAELEARAKAGARATTQRLRNG